MELVGNGASSQFRRCSRERLPAVLLSALGQARPSVGFSRKGGVMPLIKPRTRGKQLIKHRTRLDRENNETLYAYAHFLGESTEYVLNEIINTVLAKDKEYLQWRSAHPQSFVPPRAGRGRRSR